MSLESVLSTLADEVRALRLTIAGASLAPTAAQSGPVVSPAVAPERPESIPAAPAAGSASHDAAARPAGTASEPPARAPQAPESVAPQRFEENPPESRTPQGGQVELPPVADAVTARRSEQAKKAADVEPGLQAKIEITKLYNDAREKGLSEPCGALIIEACKAVGFPRFSAVPADRLPELVAAFSAAVTARQEA